MLLLSICWAEWITLLIIAVVIYYVYVIVKYAREDMLILTRWASAKKKEADPGTDEETDEDVPGVRATFIGPDTYGDGKVIVQQDGNGRLVWEKVERQKDEKKPEEMQEATGWQLPPNGIMELLPLIEKLAIEVRQFCEKRVEAGIVREELIMGLKVIVDKEEYKEVKDLEFAEFVKGVLLIAVSSSCYILLDAGEMERVWSR